MAWSSKHSKHIVNMKVKRWFRRRSSAGEFDTRIGATNVGNQPHTYDNMLGLTWRRRNEEDMEQDWKTGGTTIFRCTEAEVVADKIWKFLAQVNTPWFHELHNISWEPHHWIPCRKAPQKHIQHAHIWCLQEGLQIHLRSGGWVQKCTANIWEKGSDE